MVKNREYTVSVDFLSTDTVETPITFKQFDYGTSTINFVLLYEGFPLIVRDVEEIVAVFKAKSNIVTDRQQSPVKAKTLTINPDGTLTVLVPKQILKNNGVARCEIVVVDKVNGDRKTSPDVSFTIIKSLLDFDDLIEGE